MSNRSGIAKILTLRCEESTELSSRALDERLTVLDRIAQAGHFLSCASCRRFRRQIATIRTLLADADSGATDASSIDDPRRLSLKARERIARKLHDDPEALQADSDPEIG